jgi:hypothetical protein
VAGLGRTIGGKFELNRKKIMRDENKKMKQKMTFKI